MGDIMQTYVATTNLVDYMNRVIDLYNEHGNSQYLYFTMALSLTEDISQAKVARLQLNPSGLVLDFNDWLNRMVEFFPYAFRALFDNWNMNDTDWLPSFSWNDQDGSGFQIETESFLAFDLKWSPFLINNSTTAFDLNYGSNMAQSLGFDNVTFPDFTVQNNNPATSIRIGGNFEGDNRIKLVDHDLMIDQSSIEGNPTAEYDVEKNTLRACFHVDPAVTLFTASILASHCGGPG